MIIYLEIQSKSFSQTEVKCWMLTGGTSGEKRRLRREFFALYNHLTAGWGQVGARLFSHVTEQGEIISNITRGGLGWTSGKIPSPKHCWAPEEPARGRGGVPMILKLWKNGTRFIGGLGRGLTRGLEGFSKRPSRNDSVIMELKALDYHTWTWPGSTSSSGWLLINPEAEPGCAKCLAQKKCLSHLVTVHYRSVPTKLSL